MKKIYSLIIVAGIFAACSQPAEDGKSVDDVIAGQNAEEIKTKKEEVLQKYDAVSADLAKLEAALAELDTTKKLPIVTAYTVAMNDFKHYFKIQGDVATKQNIILTPEYQGTLMEIYVSEGDRVSKGQLLAKIDDGGLNQQLAQAEVRAELAKTTYERRKRLWDQKIGSEIQYLQSKTEYETASSMVDQMKSQFEKTSIRAPFSGVIDDVITDEGSVVGPQTPIFRIVNLSDMYVQAAIPESYIGRVVKGSEVKVELPSLGIEKESKVRQVGSFINPGNRTFNIEVPVQNGEGIMKPNLIVNLMINDYSNELALLIPDDIIQENAKGEKYVYVLSEPNAKGESTLSRAEIKTGYAYNDMIEVLEGLEEGQTVVKEGAKSMREGLVVKVKS